MSSGDNSNIISARVARETFGVAHVVARIYDPKRAEVYERLGYSYIEPELREGDGELRAAREGKLPKLIEATCARQLDALTFTSAPGAEATLAVAGELGRRGQFVAGRENRHSRAARHQNFSGAAGREHADLA